MVLVRVPNTLRSLTGGTGEVDVDGRDLADVLAGLEDRHSGFTERVMTDDGRLRGFVNVFVDDTECRRLDGLATPVTADTVVSIVPAVAGG
ncbi:MAG: MoaD/ThiS family protein [Actinomycetota bacterium]